MKERDIMFRIGLSTNQKDINEKLFKAYQKSGIEYMEISMRAEEHKTLDHKAVYSLARVYGVNLWSYHLPYDPFEEIDISAPELCKKTIEYFKELINKASAIGIDKFIVHPSGEPIEEGERAERLKCSKASLYELVAYAKQKQVTIAVEDLPRSCLGRNSEELLKLTDVDESLRICFDTNHLLGEDIADFIRAVGKRIVTTHISDYDFVNERHWLPGEGRLDWQAVARELKNAGYNGVWLYEIPFRCPPTIIRDRALCCDDFVRNANEIFGDKKITVISKPVLNLDLSNH